MPEPEALTAQTADVKQQPRPVLPARGRRFAQESRRGDAPRVV